MRILSIFLSLISYGLLAQHTISLVPNNIERGTIYLSNKKTVEGKIIVPLLANQKRINYRYDGKKHRVQSTNIDSIVFDSKATLLFTSTEFYNKRKQDSKKVKRAEWLRKIVSGDLSIYETTYIEHRREYTNIVTHYFFKRKNETLPTLIAIKTNEPFPTADHRLFRINLEKYFSNEEDFLALIKRKEFGLNELHLIAKEYNGM